MKESGYLTTPCSPTWCPGCGNLNIWGAFKSAAIEQGWNNANTVLVAGIGCHGHILNFLKLTSFEGLHGRALPVATGIKLANGDLNVFVFTGDGDCFGEGGNHFIHACRRNHNLTVLIHDNSLYALTTGQTSPLSPHGLRTKSTPTGNPDEPFNPLALAIISGATFVARAYAGDMPKLTSLIVEANKHRGIAVIDILQPCVTYNKTFTHQFFRENTYYLGEKYDPTNREEALIKSQEFGTKQIPLGIFYKVDKPSYEDSALAKTQKNILKKSIQPQAINELFKNYT
ncbi:MAG: 2-oxoglutarate ferredoxin oxidoreductase subunit beta [Patescibacteria group bacterium]|nr:MAG: 2-oxoglutarate ferredoxin oxidoreductase subunit beta [Patescibacteria group bacterium]